MKYLIVTICILPFLAKADEIDEINCNLSCVQCDQLVSRCQGLVDAQDKKIIDQNKEIKDLQNLVVDEKEKEANVPWYAYLGLGVAGGAVGGPVGAAIVVVGGIVGVVKEELR